MKKIWKFVKTHMKKSQLNQVKHVDKHRTSASNYQMKDQIWLFAKNIQIDRSFRKLDHKMLKSFKILKKHESFYKLDLSNEMSIHSIFHTSLLRKNLEDSLSEQIILLSSSIVIDDEQKFDVENIVDSCVVDRTLNKRLQYKIRWIEHSSDRKWYSIENFNHAREIIVDYHQRYFDKSRSHFLIIQSLFITLMTHLINSFSWAQKSIQKTKNMIENILNKMKKKWNSALLSKLRSLTSNETILIRKRLIKIISSLRQLASKESCLIRIEREIMSRFRINLLVRWSVSRKLINENKRRRFISSHNSFFLSHFFDLLLLVTK